MMEAKFIVLSMAELVIVRSHCTGHTLCPESGRLDAMLGGILPHRLSSLTVRNYHDSLIHKHEQDTL